MRGPGIVTIVSMIYLMIVFGFLIPPIVNVIAGHFQYLNILAQAFALFIPISFLIAIILIPINFASLSRFFGSGGQPPEGFREQK